MPNIEHLDMKIDWSVLTEAEQITLHGLLGKAHGAYLKKTESNPLYADFLMEQQEQM